MRGPPSCATQVRERGAPQYPLGAVLDPGAPAECGEGAADLTTHEGQGGRALRRLGARRTFARAPAPVPAAVAGACHTPSRRSSTQRSEHPIANSHASLGTSPARGPIGHDRRERRSILEHLVVVRLGVMHLCLCTNRLNLHTSHPRYLA